MDLDSKQSVRLDWIIENGIFLLIIFPPIAFAAVYDWSSAIMQTIAFFVAGTWLLKISKQNNFVLRAKPLLVLIGFLLCYVILQIIPFPVAVLEYISPKTVDIYRRFLGADIGSWRTISIAPGRTIAEFLKVVSYVVTFIVIIHHFCTRKKIKRLVLVVVGTACVLVVVAIAQKAAWNGRIYWFYPVDPALENRVAYIWGPYANRNHFAGYLEMVVPIALGLVSYEISKRGNSIRVTMSGYLSALLRSRNYLRIIMLILVVAILTGALFATLSRGAVLAFILSTAVFFPLASKRISLKRATSLLLSVGIGILLVIVLATWERIFERYEDLAEDNYIQRPTVWADSMDIVADHILWGTGLGTFSLAFPMHQKHFAHTLFEHAENDYIETITDLGIVGTAIVISLVIVYLHSVLRRWRNKKNTFSLCIAAGGIASIAAIATHSFLDFNLRVPANAMLLSVVSGATYAAVFCVSYRSEKKQATVASGVGQL